MDTEREEIPINTDHDMDEPLLDEASEENILEEDAGLESDDLGGYNELPQIDEVETSYDIGDLIIILLGSKDKVLLCTISEIIQSENILKMKDEEEKEYSFIYENGVILMTTENYEIIDMIKVKPHDPIKEELESDYQEIEFETEVLLDKIYSELSKRDDLLSSLIHSMNIYDNNSKIKRVQETIDILFEMINYKDIIKNDIPSYMIPIIDDNLKLYDNKMLDIELTDEINNLTNITSYREYINNNIKYSKPIETTNGYGLITDEYSNTYLRNCLRDDNCFGPNGSYTYDERKNNHSIQANNEKIVLPNRLRFIGFLEEPINEYIYSINDNTLDSFSVLEKYIYDKLNSELNMYKKDKIKSSIILNSEGEERELDKFLLHNIEENDYGQINIERVDLYNELGSLLLNDDSISNKLYNYNDIEKALFKYDISFNKLSLSDRQKLDSRLIENIKTYPRQKYYYKTTNDSMLK